MSHNGFTLDHLYGQKLYGSAQFVEVGWYKGEGGPPNRLDVSLPHYYRVFSDTVHGYQEYDYSSPVPSVGVTYSYKLLFAGHNMQYNESEYHYFFGDLTTARSVVLVSGMDGFWPLAGGEIRGANGSGNHMSASATDVEIGDHSYVMHLWDTGFTTRTCEDPGFTYTPTHQYWQFLVDGYQ